MMAAGFAITALEELQLWALTIAQLIKTPPHMEAAFATMVA
jgi:hypothetical protein